MDLEVRHSREAYRQLCTQEANIPLFSQVWWLHAVAEGEWDVVLAYSADSVVGALPYVTRRKWGLTVLTQPKLTQALGPWVRSTERSYPKAIAYETDVLSALAGGLPRFDYYAQNWHCDRQNWLGFYWSGFEQTTRYTYRLHDLADQEGIWKGLRENIRREIRKARDRYQIMVRPAHDLDEFLKLNRMTFDRQSRAMPYSKEFVVGIDEPAAQMGVRDSLVAVDPEGSVHAGAYIVRHGDTAYYLMGGGDPNLRTSGATSLVLWEAITRQPQEVQSFDFGGSMIESIERYFRSFGARQTPYFRVTRINSRLVLAADFIRRVVRSSD